MKKRCYSGLARIGVCLLLGVNFQCAQVAVEEQTSFQSYFGGQGIDRGVSVEQLLGGGFVIVGYSTSSGREDEDVLLIRTDAQGREIWTKTYGGTGKDNGWDVACLDDGGFLIAGFSNSFDGSDFDMYLIRTDSHGDIMWEDTFGAEGDDYAWSLDLIPGGGFVLAGETGEAGVYGEGDRDFYIIRFDPEGSPLWARQYGGPKTDRCFSVLSTRDAGFILAGSTTSYGAGDVDAYLIKTDGRGELQWSCSYGEAGFDMGHDVYPCDGGGFMIFGYKVNTATDDGDVWLVKTDSEGTPEWETILRKSGNERAVRGQQTFDKGYIVSGYCLNEDGRNWDVLLIKTDQRGSVIWTKTFGGFNVDTGYGVKQTSDRGFVLTGWTNSYGSGEFDVLLVKTGPEGEVDN